MSAFVDSLLDLLMPLGEVRARKMFGGHGIYKDGVMFGLVADERFYIKTDDESKEAFIARDCEPFVFGIRNDKPVVSKYYEPPESACINARKMKPWAMLGIEAAARSAKPNKPAVERAFKSRAKKPKPL